jgi:hypothetical protein
MEIPAHKRRAELFVCLLQYTSLTWKMAALITVNLYEKKRRTSSQRPAISRLKKPFEKFAIFPRADAALSSSIPSA